MSDLGFRTIYRYYCIDDDKWITEERSEGSTPLICIDDPSHEIKNGTTSIIGKNLRIKQIKQTNLYSDCDLRYVNEYTVVSIVEDLARRTRVLEELLSKNNLIRFT